MVSSVMIFGEIIYWLTHPQTNSAARWVCSLLDVGNKYYLMQYKYLSDYFLF